MRMFNPLANWALIGLIIECRCHSTTIGGLRLGTLRRGITNVDWTAVRVGMDGAHVIGASTLPLERLWAARVVAW